MSVKRETCVVRIWTDSVQVDLSASSKVNRFNAALTREFYKLSFVGSNHADGTLCRGRVNCFRVDFKKMRTRMNEWHILAISEKRVVGT